MSDTARHTYDLTLLDQSAATWRQSPALRLIYGRLYARARQLAQSGPALEIGSGIGVIKEFWPDIVTSDIAKTQYVDRAVSAYELDKTGPWATIVAMDVLHHLTQPFQFFESAARALEADGTLIIIEPAATPWGKFLYQLCHHEPCKPKLLSPPFEFAADANGEFANMGMAQSIFAQHQDHSNQRLQAIGLRVESVAYHDVIAYFLTGGFSKRLPTPTPLIAAISSLEDKLPNSCKAKLGTRMTLALRKLKP
ncbi:class I SAM-dependent methyltransferase [Cerasicoccus frondis]|uniref:class I SAM-dependent methyltransferase n=1 Tax=Cerasicoccus frondis TaxID=490090 RepID=UPI00285284B6|nr:methyltransferase domain-containing protein [Cerasicoccus frondis]